MYKILITRFDPRPKEEVEKIINEKRSLRRFNGDDMYSHPGLYLGVDTDLFNPVKELEVSLTEEEFIAVKKGVLEII